MDLSNYSITFLIIFLISSLAILIFFYIRCSSKTCANVTCANVTCANVKPLLSSSNPARSSITYQDVVNDFTQSIKNMPPKSGTNSPDITTFAAVLEALKDPKNVIMPEQLVNMTPQQVASLTDMQLYITDYITSMYLERYVCLSSAQLIALSPNQILNLNPVQVIFAMTQINAMPKNPLSPDQQSALNKLGF